MTPALPSLLAGAAGLVPGWTPGAFRGGSRGADAVVTGAGSGIGRALSLELARRGGRVVCADRDHGAAVTVAAEVESTAGGRGGLAVTCDVTDHAQVAALATRAEAWFGGPVTLLVNNAGIGTGGSRLGDDDLADWHATHAVDFWGVVHGCHVFVPRLRAGGGGGVLNVASAAAFGSAPRMGAYNTAKAAVVSLSETLAAESGGDGIAVSVLCPTFVRTGIVDAGRITADAGSLAARLMDLTGRSPDDVARYALDAHDLGWLYAAPQIEARLFWAAKRLAPTAFTRAAGLMARVLDTRDPAPAHLTAVPDTPGGQ